VVQRILDILRFLWAIVLAMVDGLSEWLNLLTKQYRDTSTVLCKERYLHIHKIGQVMSTDNTRRVLNINYSKLLHYVAPKSAFPFQPGTTAEPSGDNLSEDGDILENSLNETDAETNK
jgi:hypothetical protein